MPNRWRRARCAATVPKDGSVALRRTGLGNPIGTAQREAAAEAEHGDRACAVAQLSRQGHRPIRGSSPPFGAIPGAIPGMIPGTIWGQFL